MKRLFVILLALVAIGSLVANAYLYNKYSSSRAVMRVGNDAITIKEYRDALDYYHGKTVLNKMVLSKIVSQAAKKEGVSPSEADVDTRLADIQRRTPAVLNEASRDPQKMKELRENLMLDIALENLILKKEKLTDAQVRAFYDQNKNLFALPSQSKTLIVVASNSVDAATASELLKQPSTTGAMLANQPRLRVVGINFQPNWETVSAKDRSLLGAAVQKTPVGGVTVVPAAGAFFAVRVDSRANAGVEPFEKVKTAAARLAGLQKGPRREVMLVELYKTAGIKFEMENYAGYFKDFDEAVHNLDSKSATTTPATSPANKPATSSANGGKPI